MTRDWLDKEEAVRTAFDHRWRGLPHSKLPILITDFNPMSLRVFEVMPDDWSNPLSWKVTVRLMSDRELAEIERLLATFPVELRVGVGATVMKHNEHDVHIRGFIKRPKLEGSEVDSEWMITMDIYEIKTRYGAKSSQDIGDYDRFLKDHSKS